MNTRTGQNAMNEEFLIVVNPTMDDISILGPHIRFTADNRTRTVYAWQFSSGHHADVSIGLKLKDSYSCPDVFRGAAVMVEGAYRFADSDFLSSFRKYPGEDDRRFLIQMVSIDWSWVNEYIIVTPYIAELETHFCLREKDYIYE
jgi:hypothetical protein